MTTTTIIRGTCDMVLATKYKIFSCCYTTRLSFFPGDIYTYNQQTHYWTIEEDVIVVMWYKVHVPPIL